MNKKVPVVKINIEPYLSNLKKLQDDIERSVSLPSDFDHELMKKYEKIVTSSIERIKNVVSSGGDITFSALKTDAKIATEIFNELTKSINKSADALRKIENDDVLKETTDNVVKLRKELEKIDKSYVAYEGPTREEVRSNEYDKYIKKNKKEGKKGLMHAGYRDPDLIKEEFEKSKKDLKELEKLRDKGGRPLTANESTRLKIREKERDVIEAITKAEEEAHRLNKNANQREARYLAKRKAVLEEIAELEQQIAQRELEIGVSNPYSQFSSSLKFDQEAQDLDLKVLKAEFAHEDLKPDEPGVKLTETADDMIMKFFSIQAVLNMAKIAIKETTAVVKELDAAFVGIAVVTQYSTKEVWGMYDAFRGIAQESSLTVAQVANVAGEYFRQGESYSNVIKLTEAASKAAKVAGIDAMDAVNYLTSAVRGYNMAADQAMIVSDKFAAIAAGTATDFDGMATAFSKVAAQAYASNVEFDNLMGIMATSMEVTQEAPENIGTAFKTIFARMAEIKDYGAVLEDGIDANRIEKALKIVNVSLFDQNREMRALDDVLLEVGAQWSGLNQTQKAYLATTLAGTRQQTRLLAVFENYDKTLKNIEISRNAEGSTNAQQMKNLESLESAINRVGIAKEKFINQSINSSFIKSLWTGLGVAIETVNMYLESTPGKITQVLALLFAARTGFRSIQLILKKSETVASFVEILKDGVKSWDTFQKAGVEKLGSLLTGLSKTKAGAEGVGKALVGVGGSATKGIGTASTLVKALSAALSPTGIAVMAIGAAAIAVGAKFLSADERIKRTTKSLNKLKGEMYTLNESSNNIKELVKEYEQLERQSNKTTEELARQKEILQLIKDMDISKSYKFDVDGKLNMDSVEDYLKKNEKEQEKLIEKQTREGFKHRGVSDSKLSDENIRDRAKSFANVIFGAEMKSASEIYNPDDVIAGMQANEAVLRDFEISKEKLDEVKESVMELAISIGSNTEEFEKLVESGQNLNSIAPVIESAANAIELVKEGSMSAADAYETIKAASGDLYDTVVKSDATTAMAERWKDLGATSLFQLSKIDKAINESAKHGIEITKEMGDSLVRAFDAGGMRAFFGEMNAQLRDVPVSGKLNYLMAIQGIFDEMTSDNLMNALKVFDSMNDRISGLNDSLDNLNAESLKSLIDLMQEYPEHAESMVQSILKTGAISEEVNKAMVASEKDRMVQQIENEIIQSQAKQRVLEKQIESYRNVLEDQAALSEIAANNEIDISALTGMTILDHLDKVGKGYEKHYQALLEMTADFASQESKLLAREATSFGISAYRGGAGFEKANFSDGTEEFKKRKDATKAALEEAIRNATTSLSSERAYEESLKLALGALGNDTWNKSLKDTAKGAEKAAAAVEMYYGVLNKLYVAQRRLELVNWGVDLLKTKEAYAEVADAAEGLAGAQRDIYKGSSAAAMEDQFNALSLYKEELKNIISVSDEYRDDLVNKLNPSLKGTYEIINGKIIPVSSRYKRLTQSQMQELDEFAESFNKLTDDMQGYETQLYNTEKAQNELLISMRDTIIDYQKLIIETIKNEEKKQLDSFKKIIDANKKYIEERKKLYEKSFETEDNEKEAESISEQRQKLIEKLASLEAAHDITSIQRRAEYQKELADLDEQYNNLMLERNRDALLESLDNQSQYQDDLYSKEEEAYNNRIESGIWLEERMKQIQDEARLQAILDNISHNTTIQDMLNEGYLTQEEIARLGLTDMNVTIDELSNEQQAMLKEYWGGNRDIIDSMWNATEGKVGAKKLSEDAMNHILTYLQNHSKEMEGQTEVMKDKVLNQWKSMMSKVSEYTQSFNATKLKAPDTSSVTKGLNDMLGNIKKATEGILLQYDRQISKANQAASAHRNASNVVAGGGKAVTYTGTLTGSSSRHAQYVIKGSDDSTNTVLSDSRGTLLNGKITTQAALRAMFPGIKWNQSAKAFKTGGTTERTGLHWLDGSPGRPERVLSPGQNVAFEKMMENLSNEAKKRNSLEALDDTRIIEALYRVENAIYSTELDPDEISKGLGGNGITLTSIMKKNGINTNKGGR